jgi:hypothetical protein
VPSVTTVEAAVVVVGFLAAAGILVMHAQTPAKPRDTTYRDLEDLHFGKEAGYPKDVRITQTLLWGISRVTLGSLIDGDADGEAAVDRGNVLSKGDTAS